LNFDNAQAQTAPNHASVFNRYIFVFSKFTQLVISTPNLNFYSPTIHGDEFCGCKTLKKCSETLTELSELEGRVAEKIIGVTDRVTERGSVKLYWVKWKFREETSLVSTCLARAAFKQMLMEYLHSLICFD
jgi:hypothetical protein